MRIISSKVFLEDIERMLSEGNDVELRCFGSSMQPYLRGDGSETIVASPFTAEELIRGAIVLFRYHGKFVCHRIIRREKDKLLLQGDGSIKKQEQITVSEVIGIVRTITRRNKKPVSTQTKAARCYWRCWLRFAFIRRYLLKSFRMMVKSEEI